MRILFVNHTGIVSGAERSMLSLMEAISKSDQVFLLAPAGELHAKARSLGIETIELPPVVFGVRTIGGGFRLLYTTLRAASTVRKTVVSSDIDLIHANSTRAGLISGLANQIKSRPLVVHVRDTLFSRGFALIAPPLLKRFASVIICVSHFTACRFDSDNSHEKLVVIYNPITLPNQDRCIVSATSHSGEATLAHIAQIAPWKGQDTAIKAVGLLQLRGVKVRLLVAGSIKETDVASVQVNRVYLESIRCLVEELGLQDSVEFLGEVEDIPKLLASSTLVVLPSHEEPFGRVIVEAMAAGRPVIATSVGGPKEIITHGVNGWLVAPADPVRWAKQIEEILMDRVSLALVSRNAQTSVVDKFTVERHAAQIRKQYRALCKR